MTRPRTSRTMTLESLEKREVLTAAPTAIAQYTLELINLARTNPAGAAAWIQNHITADDQATLAYYNLNLQTELNEIASAAPQPALAWNSTLAQTAQTQANDQVAHNYQGHSNSAGVSYGQRLTNAGYNATSSGEDDYAYATSVDNAIKAFLIDWGVADQGHRKNILQPGVSANNAYREVGIGVASTGAANVTSGQVGPYVVTIDFGSQANQQAQLLGVAYNDAQGTGLYAPGEGSPGIVVEATNIATGQATSAATAAAGGYQMPLAPGTYQVSDVDNGVTLSTQTVNIGTTNVKVDFSNIPTTPPQAPAYVAPAAPTPTPVVAAPIVSINQLMSFVTNWIGFRGDSRIS